MARASSAAPHPVPNQRKGVTHPSGSFCYLCCRFVLLAVHSLAYWRGSRDGAALAMAASRGRDVPVGVIASSECPRMLAGGGCEEVRGVLLHPLRCVTMLVRSHHKHRASPAPPARTRGSKESDTGAKVLSIRPQAANRPQRSRNREDPHDRTGAAVDRERAFPFQETDLRHSVNF